MSTPSSDDRKWYQRCSVGPADSGPGSCVGDEVFRELFERSADAMALLDPVTKVLVDANPAAARLMRAPNKALLLQVSPLVLSPVRQPDGRASRELAREVVRRACEGGSHRFEWTVRRFDGSELPIETVLTALQSGDQTLLLSVSRDISERRRVEAELRDSQRLISSLVKNLSEGVFVEAPGAELVFANDAYLRMFGFASVDELRETPRDQLCVDPAQRALLLERWKADGSFRNEEMELVRRDGVRFWGLVSAFTLPSPQPEQGRYRVGTVTDITGRKRIESELRASEERWRLVFEQFPLSVQVFAPDGRTRRVNRAWERLFCMTLEDLARFSILEDQQLMDKGVLSYVLRAFAGEVTAVPPVPFELRLSPDEPTRGVRWIGSLMFPLFNEQGRLVEVVCVHEDQTDRRRAEEEINRLNASLEERIAARTAELSASEARLRTLVEHAPEVIVVFDGETGRFLSVNENATRFFGRSREELTRLTPADVSPELQPDGRPSAVVAREKIDLALAGKAPVFEWLHRHADGRLFNSEIRLVRFPDQERVRVRASIIDNTERHRRERIQEATFGVAEAVLATADLRSLYLRIHSIVRSLMPAENFYLALLDPVTDTITFPYYVDEFNREPPGPLKLTSGLTGAVLRSGKPVMLDRQAGARRRQLGDQVIVEGVEVPFRESGRPAAIWLGVPLTVQGRVFGVMAVQDYHNERAYGEEDKQILTFVAAQIALAIERKRSEEALRESEGKFRALFEASSQGVMLHDEEQYLEVNPAALRIIGYDRADQLIGKHPQHTSPPIQPDGVRSEVRAREYIAQCLEEGSARFEWMSRTARGEDVPLEVILTRIPMGGRPIIQAVVNDISERKRAEAELLKALAQEKELNQLKSSFVSMVSHEFRTPLGIIMSSTEIIEDYFPDLDAAERQQHLVSIKNNTRRMAELMEEVLLLSRFEAGRMRLSAASMDLRAFCRRVTDDALAAAEGPRRIELRLGGLPAETRADEQLLERVLVNLLGNALKYSDPGQPVDFTVAAEGPDLVFTVRDRGIGIPAADVPWVFRSFHRGQNVGQRPGTGLGLVIVKRCVELHGGTIRLESEVGVGTTMTVRLPALSEAGPGAAT